MATESRADFARRMGWNRSSVTRAVRDGRVVVNTEGQVEVEVSLERIEALASPAPHHRAHAQALEDARKAPVAPMAEEKPVENIAALNLRLKRAEADKREREAESARLDLEAKAGNLIDRADVDFALDELGAILRGLMDNLAPRLAPIVQPLQSLEEIHAAIDEAGRDVLNTVHDHLGRSSLARSGAEQE